MIDNIIKEMFSRIRGERKSLPIENKNYKSWDDLINSIPKKELYEAYNDPFIMAGSNAWDNPFDNNENSPLRLHESFKFAVSPEFVEDAIRVYTRLRNWQIHKSKGKNGVGIYVLLAKNDPTIRLIKLGMKKMGYFFARSAPFVDKYGKEWIKYQFDPLIQDDNTNEILKQKFLYHITPQYNVDSILKNGLLPRHDNDIYYYPDRVYMFATDDMDKIKKWGYRLYFANGDERNDGNYTILQVDTNVLKNDKVKLYYDPNLPDGVYTTDKISPNAIKIKLKVVYRYQENAYI